MLPTLPAAGLSSYARACTICSYERTCDECVATKICSNCTSSARCSGCRGVLFKMRNRKGVSSSAVSPSPRKAARRQSPPTPTRSSPGDALDLPRDRAGYRRYLELLEAQGGGVSRAGARWLFEPESPALHLEHVVTKDQYETPAWLWRHYVALEHLTVDANATALNAVAPTKKIDIKPENMVARKVTYGEFEVRMIDFDQIFTVDINLLPEVEQTTKDCVFFINALLLINTAT